ncbi:hypothetical protein H0H93_005787 [Arthromyces matolae]|nr:hypothetical protein H0H93_005787 [Arthromyces matolae]
MARVNDDDYFDSPPSPPQSLEDQVHVAYAHDNMHLAKVLLLRLKGIHVSGNDDPRIAEVKDEDFDFCFIPCGRLMDEEDEKALKERQREERERALEMRRVQRLKDCERIWEQGKQRLRELKSLAVRRKELEEQQDPEVPERRVPTPPRRWSRQVPTRNVVSYKLVTPSSPREQDPFIYDFMPTPAANRPLSLPRTLSQPKSKSKSPFNRPLFDDTRSVPFSDVLTSMQGPLFPQEQHSTGPLSSSRRELLQSLLVVIEDEQEERRRGKGKAPERPIPRRKDSNGVILPCRACSSSSLSSASRSSSSSSNSSRRSWLSFSSASSSSLSTAATTPSSSPPSSGLHKPTQTRAKWFLTPPPPPASVLPTPSGPCICGNIRRTPVAPTDAPIPIVTDATFPRTITRKSSNNNTKASLVAMSAVQGNDPAVVVTPTTTTFGVDLVLRRFAQFVDLAKGFQSAYLNATVVGCIEMERERAKEAATASLRAHVQMPGAYNTATRRFRSLYPPGARVKPTDVHIFLDGASSSSLSSPSEDLLRPIPLHPLNETDEDEDEDYQHEKRQRQTTLPSPLPYELKFKPHPIPPRSPFRAVHGVTPPGSVVLRVRNVENPVYLRVMALENEVRAGSIASGQYTRMWYGAGTGMGMVMTRPSVREGGLACGREKLLRIAYEGIGKSGLRHECLDAGVSNWRQREETHEWESPQIVQGRGRVRVLQHRHIQQRKQEQDRKADGGRRVWERERELEDEEKRRRESQWMHVQRGRSPVCTVW